MEEKKYLLSGKAALVFFLILAPIGFVFAFITYPLLSPFEKWSDKIISAEFNNEEIVAARIVQDRGTEMDVITVNDEEFVLNFASEEPQLLIDNLQEYKVNKKANSNLLKLEQDGKFTTMELWDYDRTKFLRTRILLSSIAFFFFIGIGMANYYVMP